MGGSACFRLLLMVRRGRVNNGRCDFDQCALSSRQRFFFTSNLWCGVDLLSSGGFQ